MDKIIEDYIERIQLSMKLNFDKHLKKKREKYLKILKKKYLFL